MTQRFYEEVGSMSEERAYQLIALFNEDPHTKELVINYFNGIPPTTGEDADLLFQAITYLRHKANILANEESHL
jgi:hypothetical protein